MELTVKELAARIGAELQGAGEAVVDAVGPVTAAKATDITFVTDDKHLRDLQQSSAAAAIVTRTVDGLQMAQLVVEDVNAALIASLKLFAPVLKAPTPGVDASAKIGDDVDLGEGVSIGAGVVIADGVSIGDRCVIGPGCSIGQNTTIGPDTRLDANVVVYHNCRIGCGVVIQANSTIGATGFGYRFVAGAHQLIPHNGGAIIEDYVELGANVCVDRAKFGNTIVGAGTKIDNLVQIGHNVVMGKCCLIAAQAGVSGSCRIGDGVVIAGQVGLADHIEIGDRAVLTARAGVMSNVEPGKVMTWTPAMDHRDAMRTLGHVMRLPRLAETVKELTKRIDKLEAAENDKK